MRHRRSESGNAVIEFALSFSLLWLLFTGAFQFGYVLYVYTGLNTAATNAARAAARATLNMQDRTAFESYVKNMAVYGNPAGTGAPAVPNLTTANVLVTVLPEPAGAPAKPPDTVTVAINNYRVNVPFSTVTFTGKPRATMPYIGNFMIP